jgi:predicted metal-dependent hydrolase
VDLFNFGYWWECHEVLEGFWRAVGPKTEQGSAFQALIDLAAGNLKLVGGRPASALKLWQSGLLRLEKLPSLYMGLDIRALERAVRRCLDDPSSHPIHLNVASSPPP